jgi:hypothetical protein
MRCREISTPEFTSVLVRAGFRSAIGPEMPLAASLVLENGYAPGVLFIRLQDCPLQQALQHLLADLAKAAPRSRNRRV